ncbi:MAG: Mth938-like domain-containing protein [Rhodomicrobium sp.]
MSASFRRISEKGPVSILPGGAFQVSGKPHTGALLISSSGVYAWTALSAQEVDEAGLLRFLDAEGQERGDFLLLGTGPSLILPPGSFRHEVDKRGLGLEVMDTPAACRTYGILLGEGRAFTAALLPT